MISIAIFNNLIICNGFGARIALLLFVLVIVGVMILSDFFGVAINES